MNKIRPIAVCVFSKVIWKSLDEFGPGFSILYPDGLLKMLRGDI